MPQMGKSSKKAHPTPPKTTNHREYIRDVSPEMAAEVDAAQMRGVEPDKPAGPSRKAQAGSNSPIRSTR